MKKIIIGAFLFMGLQVSRTIYPVSIQAVAAGVSIVQDSWDLATFVKAKVMPNEYEKDSAYILNYKIAALKAEDLFHKCLVKHAHGPRAEDLLPIACQQATKSYMLATDPRKFMAQRDQFLLSTKDLVIDEAGQDGWSNRKKALVGGAVVVVGAGTVVAAPIVLPGTVIAAKSVALVGSVKAGVVAAGAKIASTGMVAKIASVVAKNKLISIYAATFFTKKTRPLVYETPAEELASLKAAKQKRTPLGEQIRLAQAKK